MIGRTNAGGGGGLNFSVVGGTTTPSSKKENLLWVNTASKITSYMFSATEPESPTEGMVWIQVGTSSITEFNALKKNCIKVYPIAALQYIGGVWKSVESKCYQGGQWVEMWNGKLYWYGNKYEYAGGEWTSNNFAYASANIVAPIFGDDYMQITSTAASSNACISGKEEAIDLSDYTTLTAKVTCLNTSGYQELLVLNNRDSQPSGNVLAYAQFVRNGVKQSETVEIDLTGINQKAYIIFRATALGSYKVCECELKQ